MCVCVCFTESGCGSSSVGVGSCEVSEGALDGGELSCDWKPDEVEAESCEESCEANEGSLEGGDV